MGGNTSIWGHLPRKEKLSIYALLTTGFFVGAGEALSKLLLVTFGAYKSLGQVPTGAAASVTGILLLVSLVINFNILARLFEIEIHEHIDSNNKALYNYIVSFTSIVLTTLELFKTSISIEDGGTNTAFVIVAIYYLFLVPLLALRYRQEQLSTSSGNQDSPTETFHHYIQFFVVSTNYAAILCLVVAIFPLIFYILMNDGWNFIVRSGSLMCYLYTDTNGLNGCAAPSGKNVNIQSIWGFNPTVLSMGAVIVFWYKVKTLFSSQDEGRSYGLITDREKRGFIISSVLCVSILAVFAVKNGSMIDVLGSEADWLTKHSTGSAFLSAHPDKRVLAFLSLKILSALSYALLFFIAFYISEKLSRARENWPSLLVIHAIVFSLFGGIAGLLIVISKALVSEDLSTQTWHLIWIHSVGFVLVLLGMWLGGVIASRYSRSRYCVISPLISGSEDSVISSSFNNDLNSLWFKITRGLNALKLSPYRLESNNHVNRLMIYFTGIIGLCSGTVAFFIVFGAGLSAHITSVIQLAVLLTSIGLGRSIYGNKFPDTSYVRWHLVGGIFSALFYLYLVPVFTTEGWGNYFFISVITIILTVGLSFVFYLFIARIVFAFVYRPKLIAIISIYVFLYVYNYAIKYFQSVSSLSLDIYIFQITIASIVVFVLSKDNGERITS